jgi:predicted MPP superfamily phosphohydrolase
LYIPLPLKDRLGQSSGRGAARFRHLRPRKGPWLNVFDVPGWEWNIVELAIDDLPGGLDGVRIVFLADLHLRRKWPSSFDGIVERLKREAPDLLLWGGDFIDDKRDHAPALPNLERLLGSVGATFGSFGVIGNHDGDLLIPRLNALGVKMIVHQRIDVPVRGGTIELIGFPGTHRVDLDERFLRAIPKRRAGVPRIVVSHYPDLIRAAEAAGLAPDLYLAGHTHGGQICLPNEWPIIRHDSLRRRYCKGVHDYGGTCLVVTRGLGFTTLPLRVFCPGEVIEIVLKK